MIRGPRLQIQTLISSHFHHTQFADNHEPTAHEFWISWRDEQSKTADASYQVKLEHAPSEIQSDLAHFSKREAVAKQLREWNPSYGIKLPTVAKWIMNSEHPRNRRIFEAIDMDHDKLVQAMIDDPAFGRRMRFEIAQRPDLLNFLPEADRWQVLENAVCEFGTAIDWSWPDYGCFWSKEKTVQLVRKLIANPDLAGGFLNGEKAHVGWRMFNLDEFLETIRETGNRAPYELNCNRHWIATYIGYKLEVKKDSELVVGYTWPNLPEENLEKLELIGKEQTLALLEQVFENLLTTDKSHLSQSSQILQEKAQRCLDQTTLQLRNAKTFAETLIDLPNCKVGRQMVEALVGQCAVENLGKMYRWLLSGDQRFNRVRLLVLGSDKANWYLPEDFQRGSWFYTYFRQKMEEVGWNFHAILHYRNKNISDERHPRAYEGEIIVRYGEKPGHWKVYLRHRSDGELLQIRPNPDMEPDIAMVSPGFDPGDPVFTDGEFVVYSTKLTLELMKPWSAEYQDLHRLI